VGAGGGLGAGGGVGVGGVGGGVGDGVGGGVGVGSGKLQAHSSPASQNARVTVPQSRVHVDLSFTSNVGNPSILPSPLLFS